MAALDEPLFLTVADEPAAPVVTVPTAMVAAVPVAQGACRSDISSWDGEVEWAALMSRCS